MFKTNWRLPCLIVVCLLFATTTDSSADEKRKSPDRKSKAVQKQKQKQNGVVTRQQIEDALRTAVSGTDDHWRPTPDRCTGSVRSTLVYATSV